MTDHLGQSQTWAEYEEYLCATLTSEGVPLSRQMEIGAAVRDGREWHPRAVGEVRAALVIATDKLEGRPAGIAMLPYVGDVREEDCRA